jgi:hypothetical protein
MKRIKLLVSLLAALVILGAMSAPIASAQPIHPLDGVWLKCKVNAKGYAVNPGTGEYSKANVSFPVYLHFVYDEANSWYDVAVWGDLGAGWTKTYDTLNNIPENRVYPTQPGENFIPDFGLPFMFSPTDYFETYHTPFIQFKYKDGVLTKAIYKGTGEVFGGQVSGGTKNYYGYFNISGTSVTQDKLPFTP